MSPRVIQLPMSGRDRRFYVSELRAAEQEHRHIRTRMRGALRDAYGLVCQEWNVRQFIGGPAEPSPTIEQALDGEYEMLEVKCLRCGHESWVDLSEVIWQRSKPITSLARVLRCQNCNDERKRPRVDLVSLRPKNPKGTEPRAAQAKGRTR